MKGTERKKVLTVALAVGVGLAAFRWEYLAVFTFVGLALSAGAVLGTAARSAKRRDCPGSYSVELASSGLSVAPNEAAVSQLGGLIGSASVVACLWIFGVLLPFSMLETEPGARIAAKTGVVVLAALATVPASRAWRLGLFPFRLRAKALAKKLNAKAEALTPRQPSADARRIGFQSDAPAMVCAFLERAPAGDGPPGGEIAALLRVHRFDVEAHGVCARMLDSLDNQVALLRKRAEKLKDEELRNDVAFVSKQLAAGEVKRLVEQRDYRAVVELIEVIRRDLDASADRSAAAFPADSSR
ncbi:MAG: hypothetical protein ACO1SV_07980 [Fimbriimonas sp.]